jgi:arylsulfatase A-like enzyme
MTRNWEFHERGFQQAVRMDRWKAVRLTPGSRLEVYALDADPHEEHDVAAANPGVVARIETTSRLPERTLNAGRGKS